MTALIPIPDEQEPLSYSARTCPRCDALMRPERHDGRRVWTCPDCARRAR
ncbi:zf-TFIIB domain-containing protein [Amnibacterium sp.]